MQVFKKLFAAFLALALILACAPAVSLHAEAATSTTTQKQLWDVSDATSGTTIGSTTTDANKHDGVGAVTATGGFQNSQAYAYRLTSVVSGKTTSEDVSLTLSSYGNFADNQITSADQILWFYVRSGLSTDVRLYVAVNGYALRGYSADTTLSGSTQVPETDEHCLSIYTIVEDSNGEAAIAELPYQISDVDTNGDTDGVEGISFLHYTSATNQNSNARVKISAGWSGWVGVPIHVLHNSATKYLAVGDALTTLKLALYRNNSQDTASGNWTANEEVYYDEFWLTDAGTMPNYTSEELLSDGSSSGTTVAFKLNARYQDGMIFQQNEDWMVHGTGTAGETVTVNLANGSTTVQTKTATVTSDNTWSVTMSPVAGSYTYYTLTAACGSTTKTVNNVAFGEVWVTGGQSNMFYKISHTDATDMFGSQTDVAELKTYLETNTDAAKAIRMYYVVSPTSSDTEFTEVVGEWHTAESWDSVYSTSAVAMHYAKKLQAELDVPVGVVVAARGGTSIGTWTDADVAKNYPEFLNTMNLLGYPTDDSHQYKSYGYYNAHVAPWQGYNVAGLLWYQGEQDRFYPVMQEQGFEAMVESFSRTFTTDYASSGLMDVIAIQIAPFFGYASSPDNDLITNSTLNAAMRAGAARVQAKGGNVVVMPIYDLPTVADDHHPLNKEDVATRLLQVSKETYYDAVADNESYSGPAPVSYEIGDGVVTITFDQDIQFIPLTAENNERMLLNTTFTLPEASEMYATDLNGFGVWTERSYVSADAVIVGKNQVQVTIPDGVNNFAGITYAYGLEVLSGNLYDMDGLPALPFVLANEDYNHRVQLWSADEVEATVIVEENASSGRNTSKISIADAVGFAGSQGLKYELVSKGNERTHTWNCSTIGDYGFKTQVMVTAEDDILWFWASANYSTLQSLQFFVNSQTILHDEDAYIYTLKSGTDGTPALTKITYGGTDSVAGIDLLKHSSNQAKIQMEPGWSGWIGIPANQFGVKAAGVGSTIEKISVLLLQKTSADTNLDNQVIGDNVVLDEFWLTSAGKYPNLANMVPLQANIWNVEDEDLQEGTDLGLAGSSSDRDTVSTLIAEGEGVGDSKALANIFTTAIKSNSNNVSLSPDSLSSYGYIDAPIQDSSNVLWFWVDSDLDDDRLLHLQLNGTDNYLGPNFIYTIVDENGAPTRKTVNYDEEALLSGDGLALVASAGKGGAADSNYARIRLDAGWCGWIGVPVANFTGIGGATAAPTGNISNITFRLAGGVDEGILNEAVYFDEFWLTEADLLPNLSNEDLLYVSDEARQISLLDFEDVEVGTTYTPTGSTSSYGTVSATVSGTKGVKDSNAFAYSITDAAQNNSQNVTFTDDHLADNLAKRKDILWFWVNSDLSGERLIHVQVNGNNMAKAGVYTIKANASGEPEMVSINYAGANTAATSMAPVNYVWGSDTGSGNYARIKVPSGWSGWVGIPVANFGITYDAITSIALRAYAQVQHAPINAGETVYFDEFWLTSEGLMPDLTDEELLYKDMAELKFSSSSLTIEDGASVNFKADASLFTTGGYTNPYAVFELNGITTTVDTYTVKDGKYVFQLNNIRPDWMGDEITATLYATNDGEKYESVEATYSVAEYCYNMLNQGYADGAAEDAFATLLVDILRYGAAAQVYTGYKTDALVTDDLAGTAWEGWGTNTDRALTNVLAVADDVEDPAVIWKSTALYLRETARIRLRVTTELTEGMTLKGFVGGTEFVSVDFEDFVVAEDGYYVFVDGLVASNMDLAVDYAIYVGDEQVSKTLTYSVESYAAKAVADNTDANLVALMKAMMRYSDAAGAYAGE